LFHLLLSFNLNVKALEPHATSARIDIIQIDLAFFEKH